MVVMVVIMVDIIRVCVVKGGASVCVCVCVRVYCMCMCVYACACVCGYVCVYEAHTRV